MNPNEPIQPNQPLAPNGPPPDSVGTAQPPSTQYNPPSLPSANAAEVGQQIMDGHTPRIDPSDIPSTPSDAARIAERNLAGEPAPIDPASITKPGETPSEAAQVADRAVGGSGQSIFNQVPIKVAKKGSKLLVWAGIGITIIAILIIGGYIFIKYMGPKSSSASTTKNSSQTNTSSVLPAGSKEIKADKIYGISLDYNKTLMIDSQGVTISLSFDEKTVFKYNGQIVSAKDFYENMDTDSNANKNFKIVAHPLRTADNGMDPLKEPERDWEATSISYPY